MILRRAAYCIDPVSKLLLVAASRCGSSGQRRAAAVVLLCGCRFLPSKC